MAGGALSENDRHCLETGVKSQSECLQDTEKHSECKSNGLRVRFLDEEGKTERTVSADETDAVVSRVKKIHILKNRSSSETSILLRNPSLMKRRSSAERRLSDGQTGNLNNNSLSENLNRRVKAKNKEIEKIDKTEQGGDQTKEIIGQNFKKNSNVYSVNQAKTLTPEKKKSLPKLMPKLVYGHKLHDTSSEKSTLPAEGSFAESHSAKDFTSRTIGRISKGIGRLLRRTNSVRISEPDPTYKVAYLGNVLTGWARGESCVEKPLATLWRNYQQSSKPDVVMKLSVSNSGLKGATKEHGLTEYWSHRITYCASPPHYPKLFCWVYRHEGKKLKHELRCHAVLCAKEIVSKKITEELQIKVKQALLEFKKDRISKQNARLSLANSVYDNPSMPRRKILLSVGAMNYRPPLERSKSAPKLGAIEELCSEEDEEEAEMNAKQNICNAWARNSLSEDSVTSYCSSPILQRLKSPRKLSCPTVMHRARSHSDSGPVSDQLIDLLVQESQKNMDDNLSNNEASQDEAKKQEQRMHTLESISESSELPNNPTVMGQNRNLQLLSQSNFLVTDSDDGSVSSGCETASTVNSDAEPTSLPSHYVQDEVKEASESVQKIAASERIQNFECNGTEGGCSSAVDAQNEVNLVPIGEKSSFRRRSTYPPLRINAVFNEFEGKFESLINNGTDMDSFNSSSETDVFKNSGDNDSACSDESGYSELLENGKDSIVGSTIMV
ncbi:uncharacterized protein LOC133518591 [Cydia pomonella]|uniref:uncharacterized protein LOC133518591 n=1 Tax=Cydia pomonella TaxID=82600 RepID=UPI002ADE4357|nr:uncharacterized protein LOC133518591 [Cydia pomonella]XP_061708240.1 uncharacterized protein LOC133518591 [Cydia pomonella]